MAHKAFRLTSERLDLVQHFVRYRYLRISHLYRLLADRRGSGKRGVRRIVRDFWGHGCLCRRVAPPDQTSPASAGEFVYWLSRKGTALAKHSGVARTALPLPREGITRTLTHELAITDFHLAARQACEASGHQFHWEQYRLRRGVNPDAMFGVTDPALPDAENTSYFFLEVERSPASGYVGGRPALVRRLQRYAAYQGSAECAEDWRWFSEFRVVVLVSSEAQKWTLLNVLRTHLPSPMFLIGVMGRGNKTPDFESPADTGLHKIWS